MICPICEGEGFTKLPYIDNRGNVKRTQLFCIVCDGTGTTKNDKHGKKVCRLDNRRVSYASNSSR